MGAWQTCLTVLATTGLFKSYARKFLKHHSPSGRGRAGGRQPGGGRRRLPRKKPTPKPNAASAPVTAHTRRETILSISSRSIDAFSIAVADATVLAGWLIPEWICDTAKVDFAR